LPSGDHSISVITFGATLKVYEINRECGMLPMGIFSIRWNIETGYYETKTFWSFNNYMIRSAEGIERLSNLICISYGACRLLPYYSRDFEAYKGLNTQEVRYQLGEQIRRSIIIRSLELCRRQYCRKKLY